MSAGKRRDGPRPIAGRWVDLPLSTGEHVIYDQQHPQAWVQSTHSIPAEDAA